MAMAASRGYSGQRTFPGHPGTARKAFGRRAKLADQQQPVVILRRRSRQLLGHPRDTVGVSTGPDPEDDGPAGTHERQAPLGRHGWQRKRLRHRDTEPIRLLLLRPPPDDTEIRELRLPLTEEIGLPSLSLQQRDLAIRQCGCERDSRCSSAGADINDWPSEAPHQLGAAETVLQ